jgi:hypothetical protein
VLLYGLRTARAPFLPSADAMLRLLHRALGCATVARVLHDLPIRCDEKHLQPNINAGLASREWERP